MGSIERRARERNQTRDLILTAARDIFIREGCDALTMRRVADAIEYTPAAIYAHFKDKLHMMIALCDSDFGLLRDAMGDLDSITDPVQRLRASGHAYVDFALLHPHHYRFMFMTPWPEEASIEPPPEIKKEIKKGNPDQDVYAFLTLLVRDCIAQGRFKPEYTDVDLVTQTCWAAAHGAVSLYITHGNDPWCNFTNPTKVARMLINSQLDGMLLQPDNAGTAYGEFI